MYVCLYIKIYEFMFMLFVQVVCLRKTLLTQNLLRFRHPAAGGGTWSASGHEEKQAALVRLSVPGRTRGANSHEGLQAGQVTQCRGLGPASNRAP